MVLIQMEVLQVHTRTIKLQQTPNIKEIVGKLQYMQKEELMEVKVIGECINLTVILITKYIVIGKELIYQNIMVINKSWI